MPRVSLSVIAVALVVYASAASAHEPPSVDLGALLHTRRLVQRGFEGQGVRVGVISDGASNYLRLIGEDILPPGVGFFGGRDSYGDEGDWMMQIVHQIASRAALAFCPAQSAQETDNCARVLVANFHAELVVDDTNPQPVFDFPSPKEMAFAELAQRHPDVLFFTGAGNNGGGYYQGEWTPVPLILNGMRNMAQDFGRSVDRGSDPYQTISPPPGSVATVILGTSADPTTTKFNDCSAKNPDVRLVLLDKRGDVLASATSHCPLQSLHYQIPLSLFGPPTLALRHPLLAPTVPFRFRPQELRIAVLLPADSDPGAFSLKLVALLQGSGTSAIPLSYHTTGGAGNSATAQHLIAVAAVDPYSGLHDGYLYEAFANSGPQCLNYERNTSGGWTRLPGPQCVQQPAFVVPDRAPVMASSPRGVEYRPFQGDSAAGPAAAGVAALLLSAGVPARRIVPLLEQSAIPQSATRGWSAHYGYGLLDADAAGVAAGLLPSLPRSAPGPWTAFDSSGFHPSPAFLQDRNLSQRAQQGDGQALTQLQGKAWTGDPDAQTWLAMYAHTIGDDGMAARWAFSSAMHGEPLAESFLGSMYNRGWGVPMDPRASQAWWLRAARAGVAAAMFNMGTTITDGRGSAPDPVLGYALMRAAALRGFHFPPMNFDLARARGRLNSSQIARGESLAAGYAVAPASIPVP